MSTIAILGITGRAGSRIADELLRRGHAVTGIARKVDGVPARKGLTVHAADALRAETLVPLLRGHDAVVSATVFKGGIGAAALADAARQAGVPRLLVVGGAGSLEVAPGKLLVDAPDFPAIYKAESLAGVAFFEALRRETAPDWTFLSPSAEFAPGQRTGTFRLGGDSLLSDASGRSHISMEDFAIALADELETPRHSRRRFTVGY